MNVASLNNTIDSSKAFVCITHLQKAYEGNYSCNGAERRFGCHYNESLWKLQVATKRLEGKIRAGGTGSDLHQKDTGSMDIRSRR